MEKITRLKRNTWLMLLVALFGLAALGVPAVRAADFRNQPQIIIGAGEVIDDDLFLTGETVEMNGTVNGDLFATGQRITINGEVNGNLFVSGSDITLNGVVNGSVFGAAAQITVQPKAAITGSASFGASAVDVQAGASIARSIYVGSYQLIFAGRVERNFYAGTSATVLAGEVGRDVYLAVSAPETNGATQNMMKSIMANNPSMPTIAFLNPGLDIREGAKVSGSFNYSSAVEQVPAFFKPEQGTQFKLVDDAGETLTPEALAAQKAQQARDQVWRTVYNAFGEFVALCLVGALLIWKFPALLTLWSDTVKQNMPRSAVWGLLSLLAFPFLLLAALIVLGVLAYLSGVLTAGNLNVLGIGLSGLAFIATVAGFTIWVLSKVVVAFWAGRLILQQLRPAVLTGKWGHYIALALGAFLFQLLTLIPLVNWVFVLIVIVLGTGAIVLYLRQISRSQPLAAVVG
jgi:cytoskeletal protein CcmA (bactofilin family)